LTKAPLEKRVAQLEKAIKHYSEGLFHVADEVAVLRKGKHNPQRQALERRVKELENKFFAFQCGAQEQIERDREAIAEAERMAARAPFGKETA
jgi:uncharacterized coiled-coil protein SlyX